MVVAGALAAITASQGLIPFAYRTANFLAFVVGGLVLGLGRTEPHPAFVSGFVAGYAGYSAGTIAFGIAQLVGSDAPSDLRAAMMVGVLFAALVFGLVTGAVTGLCAVIVPMARRFVKSRGGTDKTPRM